MFNCETANRKQGERMLGFSWAPRVGTPGTSDPGFSHLCLLRRLLEERSSQFLSSQFWRTPKITSKFSLATNNYNSSQGYQDKRFRVTDYGVSVVRVVGGEESQEG